MAILKKKYAKANIAMEAKRERRPSVCRRKRPSRRREQRRQRRTMTWEGAPDGGGPVDKGLLKEPTACYFMKA